MPGAAGLWAKRAGPCVWRVASRCVHVLPAGPFFGKPIFWQGEIAPRPSRPGVGLPGPSALAVGAPWPRFQRRVAPGCYLPGAPSDPYVRDYRIRLLELWVCYVQKNRVHWRRPR